MEGLGLMALRVSGLRFPGFRVSGSGFQGEGLGCKVSGVLFLAFRVCRSYRLSGSQVSDS